MTPLAYAELHCRSSYSFLTGASQPDELVARAHQLGYHALALTDECSLAGVVRAHMAAKEVGLHLVIGAEMRLTLPSGEAGASPQPDMRLVALAMDRRGYGNLSYWITVARRRAPKGEYRAWRADLEGRTPRAAMLAGLPRCRLLLVPEPGQPLDRLLEQARWLVSWVGPDRAGLALELLGGPHDDLLTASVRRVARDTGLPIVAAGDVLMHVRERKPLQDTMTAIRLKRPLTDCGHALQSNAEQHLRGLDRLNELYEQREWLDNTVAWAKACKFKLDELQYEYPEELVPEGHTPASWLRQLTYEGLARRRKESPQAPPEDVEQRIEKELQLIAEKAYERFFLTVADIVRWARGQGILCQGRGSAANSTVCYCLHITEVNPARASLLFERFVSRERDEPPDIDVDFEHQRREEVIQYLYGKYGRHRTALAAVVIFYRTRSALRDVGRALGLDEDRIAVVAKGQHWFDGRRVDDERLREAGLDPASPVVRQWMALTMQLIGMPRHLSQHPGGFVIAREQVAHLVPIENCAMADRTVIQWDKDDLESLGLLKVDVLALGMLSALRRAFDLLSLKLGRPFGMAHVPHEEDRDTYDMLCKADTVGVFQVESRAQMSMLPRLKPREYYDLVVQVAIVRPGPIQGGMVHPYLTNRELRRQGKPVPQPYPALDAALGRTFGVPIFQEQVMQIAMIAADFTPGEADRLRRAMAAWKRKGGLGPFHQRLVGRMVDKGYDRDYAESIFKQIEGFGEYGFPESHAASFALLVYASAWVKCHHPDVFLAALLNSQPMGFYAPAQLVRDAREHDVEVRPVDVRRSDWDSTLEGSPAVVTPKAVHAPLRPVRLGLNRINGFSREAAERIVAARAVQAFDSAEDLARRASLDAHQMRLLAEADALSGLAGHRHQAAWAVAGLDARPTALLRQTRTQEAVVELQAPLLAEDTLADYRAIGLSLKSHPMALIRDRLQALRIRTVADLKARARHGQPVCASGLVTHRQRPETANGTLFVTIEDETGALNLIVWPKVAEAQRRPLLAAKVLTVHGLWQDEKDVQHVVAGRLVDHSALIQGWDGRSRDFR
ncbi:error-prone DNA polymerase [Aquabacterium sp. J223]|uniref:error-prone DNA polymerase n=1 Tax=Aquabacterium sp. J223 TaxID=2898431 RepID=UPI0021AE2D61|nr:error-prone DNA polymerase [Aquabacterium sp. J223]UUX94013.1 error-prone DNA polymerase [Aquabacterium sp. J223]